MKKIIIIFKIISIVILLTISYNPITVNAVTQTPEPSQTADTGKYTINENGVYRKDQNNILTITFTLLRFAGTIIFIVGLLKFIMAMQRDDSPNIFGGILLMILCLLLISAPWVLEQLGWIK